MDNIEPDLKDELVNAYIEDNSYLNFVVEALKELGKWKYWLQKQLVMVSLMRVCEQKMLRFWHWHHLKPAIAKVRDKYG